ncbi:hypothetical protein C8R43DRAFT_1110335 [Mycena crocata]|nr:hypothetical protein C8R43DRAFT_1110335 [Mycena crocata]
MELQESRSAGGLVETYRKRTGVYANSSLERLHEGFGIGNGDIAYIPPTRTNPHAINACRDLSKGGKMQWLLWWWEGRKRGNLHPESAGSSILSSRPVPGPNDLNLGCMIYQTNEIIVCGVAKASPDMSSEDIQQTLVASHGLWLALSEIEHALAVLDKKSSEGRKPKKKRSVPDNLVRGSRQIYNYSELALQLLSAFWIG